MSLRVFTNLLTTSSSAIKIKFILSLANVRQDDNQTHIHTLSTNRVENLSMRPRRTSIITHWCYCLLEVVHFVESPFSQCNPIILLSIQNRYMNTYPQIYMDIKISASSSKYGLTSSIFNFITLLGSWLGIVQCLVPE
jgi:hypothetical protein